jgi:two-component system phosphate regulon sensor histidine kinase PhoR
MKRKIYFQTFAAGLLVLVLVMVVFLNGLYRYYEAQTFESLSAEASYVSAGMVMGGEAYLKTLTGGNRVTWVAPDGTVLYDNQADAASMQNHADREEIRQALSTGEGQSAHFSDTLMEKTLYHALRLWDGTVLRIATTQSTVRALLPKLGAPIAWSLLAVVVLSALLSALLARQITRPINAIDPDTPKAPYPELRPLIERIDQQNTTIAAQMDELRRRQREFAAITENMNEGFLLLDSRCNVLSGNHSARTILSVGEAANLRQSDCGAAVYAVAERALSGVRGETELRRDGRVWQLIASPVLSNGQVAGAALMTMDVTEREEREALRREFSANVSHELKTPLTSISGFAELMQAGLVPPEKGREFASDIYRESRRLIDLVDDIINLSRLEDGGTLYEQETVDLFALSDDVMQSLTPSAQRGHISLTLDGDHTKIRGAWQILHEMVYNLCDNAIKYNFEGGSVRVQITGNTLTVSDTGIGIPQGEQSRIFERFYRVDKSHSKAVGGTGLGLSIVKHGAQYHGATLDVKSEEGKGTSVSLTFPTAIDQK